MAITGSPQMIATIGPIVLPQFLRPLVQAIAKKFPLLVKWPVAPVLWGMLLVIFILAIVFVVLYIIYWVWYIKKRIKQFKTWNELRKVKQLPEIRYHLHGLPDDPLPAEFVQPDEMDVGDIFFEGAAASAKKSFGKVQWGILYDTNTNQLKVTVNRCAAVRGETAPNPFVKLRFRPPLGKGKKKEDLAAGGPLSTGLPALLGIGAHKWQTSVKRGTYAPIWNEVISVDAKYDDLKTRRMQLVVVDWDRFGNNKLLGFYEERISELDFRAPIVNRWDTLIDPDILESGGGFGQVCLVLKFLPAVCKFSVTVLECAGLRLRTNDSPPDPFVKLTLVGGGNTLQTEQTSVIHKTRNPYWNTEFLFDSTYIEDGLLLLKVYDAVGLWSTEWAQMKLGTRKAIGLTKNEVSAAADVWTEMLAQPGHPAARWLSLSKPKTKTSKDLEK